MIPLLAVALAFILASCAGTRDVTDFQVTYNDGTPGTIDFPRVGETFQLAGRVHFDNGTIDSVVPILIDWSSDNEAVATVSGNGVVEAHAVGGAIIKGSYRGFEDEVLLVVHPF